MGLTLALMVPSSGNRDLEVRQHFEQEGLELGVGLVDFVDQQHAALFLVQGLVQRARLQKMFAEKQVVVRVQPVHGFGQALSALHHLAELVLEQLGVEQLLAVFPFVQRLGFVQAFVALHADQRHVEDFGHALGELGLAHAGRAFDQDGLFELKAQIDRGGDRGARDVVDGSEALGDAVYGCEMVGMLCFHEEMEWSNCCPVWR